jgi:urea transporter
VTNDCPSRKYLIYDKCVRAQINNQPLASWLGFSFVFILIKSSAGRCILIGKNVQSRWCDINIVITREAAHALKTVTISGDFLVTSCKLSLYCLVLKLLFGISSIFIQLVVRISIKSDQ